MNDNLPPVPVWFIFTAGMVMGFWMGLVIAFIWSDMRQEAVDLGHAEWVVDQKTSKTSFKWKEAKT